MERGSSWRRNGNGQDHPGCVLDHVRLSGKGPYIGRCCEFSPLLFLHSSSPWFCHLHSAFPPHIYCLLLVSNVHLFSTVPFKTIEQRSCMHRGGLTAAKTQVPEFLRKVNSYGQCRLFMRKEKIVIAKNYDNLPMRTWSFEFLCA